jgi:hypothetical protein
MEVADLMVIRGGPLPIALAGSNESEAGWTSEGTQDRFCEGVEFDLSRSGSEQA